MAIVTDYASLSQSVQDWFARSDLDAYIDTLIQTAEDQIYNDILSQNMGRGVQPIEATLSTAIANGVLAVPTGYLGMKHAVISQNGFSFMLERKNAEFIYTQYPNRAPEGAPAYFAREGQNFIFGPYPDSNYSISGVYWKRSAPLSATNTTTWMTSSIPSTLLAACNAAAAMFLKDAQNMQTWGQLYAQKLQAFLISDRAEEMSGSALSMVAA